MGEVRERPIVFSAPMVRAILEGRKAQTRRIVRGSPDWDYPEPCCSTTSEGWQGPLDYSLWAESADPEMDQRRCPYGKPGDRLWVREAFARVHGGAIYRAAGERQPGACCGCAWKSPIFMPRDLSRITLEVTEVRVQRLQEISEGDAVSEGVQCDSDGWCDYELPATQCAGSALDSFRTLWRSIHGPAPWEANPWVWAVSFKQVDPRPIHEPRP